MSQQSKILSFFIVLYCLVYFLTTTAFYFISIFKGYGGLSLPMFGGGDDGQFYVKEAIKVYRDYPAHLTSIHSLILGYLMKILNTQHIFILKTFNYLGNLLLILVALRILKKSFIQQHSYNFAAIILIFLLMLYPTLFLISNMSIYRDIWICLYFLLSLNFFANICVVKSSKPVLINFLFLILSIGMLGAYRDYALLSFIIGSILFTILIKWNKRRIKITRTVISFLLIFSIIYTFFKNYTVPYVNLSLQSALEYRRLGLNLFSGGSQMGISLDQSNIILFYLNYFYSIVSNTFGPLPWQINGLATLIIFISESIIFLVITIFLFKWRRKFSKFDVLIIVQSTIWFMMISITNDNLGTATRLRMIGWIPLFIVFAKYYGEFLYHKTRSVKSKH